MGSLERASDDRAGRSYWDRGYRAGTGRHRFDPNHTELRAFWKRSLHRYFVEVLTDVGPGRSLLEVGCGDSKMLPYFSREFGFDVTGIDYSEPGCDRARANLAVEGVVGRVICADLFSPPEGLLQSFDVVVSFGVVEHFSDTGGCLRALGRLLKPGGVMLTTIPNMTGLTGRCQRMLDRAVFDKHVALDREALSRAHADAGLSVVRCEYLLFTNFGVVNLNGTQAGTTGYWAKLAALNALRGVTGLSWLVETVVGGGRPNRFTSPYIACVAAGGCSERSKANA